MQQRWLYRRWHPVKRHSIIRKDSITTYGEETTCRYYYRRQHQHHPLHNNLHPHRLFSSWTVNSETGIVSSSQSKLQYQTIIGLEIHAQLDISTKLFSGCPTDGHGNSLYQKPNTRVWPYDVGVPGFLPRLSKEAVKAAVLSAVATNCQLSTTSRFERKHYYYADLPMGYQITQQRWPLARNGYLQCRRTKTNQQKSSKKKKKTKTNTDDDADIDSFTVRIERIQLEQDTGKTIVMTNSQTNKVESMVDFNRAGQALIEIVFYPDIRSATDAAIAVETLRSLLKHIGTCNGKMEEGSLRCDLNVSIAPIKDNDHDDNINILERTGNRVEVKNLNSLRQVQLAAEYEAIRQVQFVQAGNPTSQETRTFDVKTIKTVTIRTKEGAKDYRFMPEPDLPPLMLNDEVFGHGIDLDTFLKQNLPELPENARQRLQSDHGLSEGITNVLIGDPPAIQLFDIAVQTANEQLSTDQSPSLKRKLSETTANLLCNELIALVREYEMQRLIAEGLVDSSGSDTSVRYSKVTGRQLGEIVTLVLEGSISNTMAKQLLKRLYEGHEELKDLSVRDVAERYGFHLITDPQELARICRQVIDDCPEEMERYKLGGKYSKKITKFLQGKAMAASRGNAHPERLNEVLDEILDDVAPQSE